MLKVGIDKDLKDNTTDLAEKLSDKNLYPLQIDMNFKFIDFIDMTEFNARQITAKDYKKELDNFLVENTIVSKEFAKEMSRQLQDKGLSMISTSVSSQKFNDSCLAGERLAMLLSKLQEDLLNTDNDEE